jgi:high affinity Mn2+ porin
VRKYTSRPGLSVNLEQQVTETVGSSPALGGPTARRTWDFTDIDRGVALFGKLWSRSDDTIGIAGVINVISSAHAAYFNAGGVGIVLGGGMLPHPGLEQIVETYYSYALSSSTKLTFDYQFIANPGYNTDRGPAINFAGRFHTQF